MLLAVGLGAAVAAGVWVKGDVEHDDTRKGYTLTCEKEHEASRDGCGEAQAKPPKQGLRETSALPEIGWSLDAPHTSALTRQEAQFRWAAAVRASLHPPAAAPTSLRPCRLPCAPVSRVRGMATEADWLRFLSGYRDWGGREEWLRHFVEDVLPCESGEWGAWYANGYVSRAQFDPGSWATAIQHTGLDDPADPYHVGAAVAWWGNNIAHPGGSGGWPTCWWRGEVP